MVMKDALSLNVIKKKYKKLIVITGAIIIISNLPPFSSIFHLVFDGSRPYRYSNADGSFTFQEIWLRDYNNMMRVYLQKRKHFTLRDKKVYRLFSKNPLAFWRWRAYFIDKRYDLPYKNWDEIERLRDKKPLGRKFVDF
ncbi:hypothetical protein [Pedobacter sp. Hv1]|uniref:hypothetical protein n=1 Tax=Pedobacter sp. Hv1 TaxID=1740090 RepID=UPI0006D8D444|nr:hypothetical protein [Pedobacter sp. Hv1]KQC01464.1 hypothetical protein AQF98_07085 [Pedobacter sp. Hv1]